MDKILRIDELINILDDLNYNYYTLDKPKLSDVEYDRLYDELVSLEKETGIVKNYSPTQRVGGEIVNKFEKHTHLGNLWSLDKAQSAEALRAWDKRVREAVSSYNSQGDERLPDVEYVLEYKFDGLTINLTYEKGQLAYAATRGNGSVGEKILAQIKNVKNIPMRVSFNETIEVQGEGIMPLSKLEEYNKKNSEPLKNARNAAAGAIRNLDTFAVIDRGILVYTYNIGYSQGLDFTTHMEMLDFLRENRLPVYPYAKLYTDIELLIDEIEKQDVSRKDLDVLTDGMVIKVNDMKTREVLGYTAKFPRWAIAYKFEAEEISTVLREVIWNVGRTSKVTPSAILDPVEIGGATVSRATLNNYDDIQRKGLMLNARVLIRRSNDVIPEILGVLETDENSIEILPPEVCPACGTELIKNGVHLFCPNSLSCKPQLISRIVHFASRDAMNIEGLSEKTAELLLEKLDIRKISSLYELTMEELLTLEGFKEKKSSNLLNAIEGSKKPQLSSFIYALGIDNVGITTAIALEKHFNTFDKLRNASAEELQNIPDIGEIVANSIVDFFKDDHIEEALTELFSHGIEPYYEDKEEIESIFSNKRVVVTGTIEGYKRGDIEEFVRKFGGKASSSVSTKTDYVIVGDSPGSKYDKAVELGIKIINQEEILKILKEGD
ncbi:MAG: NAD-dependent DNA ligase LigA [Tissierellia bacterium]|nr:NAD-dependent DNA ligase LigA [Tissierellia bacterium]